MSRRAVATVVAYLGVVLANLLLVAGLGLPLWISAAVTAGLGLLLIPFARPYFRRGRRVLLWGGAAYAVLIVLGAVAWALLSLNDPVGGDLSLVHSHRPGVRVLFVGNTITSDNDMPEMLASSPRETGRAGRISGSVRAPRLDP